MRRIRAILILVAILTFVTVLAPALGLWETLGLGSWARHLSLGHWFAELDDWYDKQGRWSSYDEWMRLENGALRPAELLVWKAETPADLRNVSKKTHLYVLVSRPAKKFPNGPPPHATAWFHSRGPDGSPVGKGVPVPIVFLYGNATTCTYCTTRPLLLIDNPLLEGDNGELIALPGVSGGTHDIVFP